MLFGSSGSGLGGKGDVGGSLGSFYSHTIDQSLKLDDGSGGHLTISSASPTATNRKKVAISCWVKRAGNSAEVNTVYWADAQGLMLQFFADNTIYIYDGGASNFQAYVQPTSGVSRLFRDMGAWYHLALIIDTTQSTAANRAKFYVNGELNALNSYPGEDNLINWHTGTTMKIGNPNDSTDLAGYIAEFISIDGQDVSISDFGETQDGVWVPKDVSGLTLGDAGFYLKFDNNSDIGNDSGSNNIDFTASNLAASDVVPDSPTNNWSTLNPLKVNTQTQAFAEGNLDFSSTQTGNNPAVTSTFAVTSGKWYWEVYIRAQGNTVNSVGIASNPNDLENDASALYGKATAFSYQASGSKRNNNSDSSYGDSWTTGDIIGVALDLTAGAVYFYKNGSIQNSGTAAFTSLSGEFTSYSLVYNSGAQVYNFGQDDTFAGNKTSGSANDSDDSGLGQFYYSVPSGYKSLCASNLPDITIGPGQAAQADDYFNTVLYTGDGASSNAITGVGFQPDWVWIKSRSAATIHNLFDAVRGTKLLQAQAADGQQDNANYLTAYGADGFTVGNSANVNASSATFVAWNWKAGGTPTGDNSAANSAEPTAGSAKVDGSNQSGAFSGSPSIAIKRLSANTTAGFSIVMWTGTGSAGTIPHALTKAPEFIFVKNLDDDTKNWNLYPTVLGNNYIELNGSGAAFSGSTYFNNTAPTADVFSVGTAGSTNATGSSNSDGEPDDYVAYCFHSVEGYSEFGSYTGNFNAQGPFIHTGFRPAWLMLKRTDSSDSWMLRDSTRNTFNVTNLAITPNGSGAEYADSTLIDFTSNGFKLRHQNSLMNASGGTFIYLAFAEAPFKFANAR